MGNYAAGIFNGLMDQKYNPKTALTKPPDAIPDTSDASPARLTSDEAIARLRARRALQGGRTLLLDNSGTKLGATQTLG